MNRITKTVSIGAVVAAFIPAIALAQVTVENTGPGSTVTVTDSTDCSIQVDNETGLVVDSSNNQDAESGDANNTENTEGGDTTTGNAGNDSSVTIDFSVNNGTTGTTADGRECVFSAAPVTTPDNPGNGGEGPTPVAPAGNGGGAGGGEVNGATTSNPAVLPESGVEDVLPALGVSALAIGSLAFGSRFALQAYQFVSKR